MPQITSNIKKTHTHTSVFCTDYFHLFLSYQPTAHKLTAHIFLSTFYCLICVWIFFVFTFSTHILNIKTNEFIKRFIFLSCLRCAIQLVIKTFHIVYISHIKPFITIIFVLLFIIQNVLSAISESVKWNVYFFSFFCLLYF